MKIRLGFLLGLLMALDAQASFRGNRVFEGPKRDGSYSFSYRVLDKTAGLNYGHEESRLGPDTSGQYHVLLPDGRTQTVRYNVDPRSGYRAFVSYAGDSIRSPPIPSFIRQERIRQEPIRKGSHRQESFRQEPIRPLESIRRDPIFISPPKDFRPSSSSPIYTPLNYSPAHLDYPQRPIVNLIVPDSQRHQPFYAPAPSVIKPLDPHKKDPKKSHSSALKKKAKHHSPKEDPYLATEEELRGRDFSGPFFYPKHRKITKDGTLKKDDGRKKKRKQKHHF